MARTPQRNPGRKRRLGGWLLLTMAVVIAGVWAASRWWAMGYATHNHYVVIHQGYASWDYSVHEIEPGWDMRPLLAWLERGWMWVPMNTDQQRFAWMPLGYYRTGGGPTNHFARYGIALWPLPPLLAALGVPLLRSGILARRRATAGLCPHCGYDRRGLPVGPGAVCPECGQ